MPTPAPAPAPVPRPTFDAESALPFWWGAASVASTALCVYHGYKRNDSLGWGLLWGLMGGVFPVVAPVVALAQGFGEPGPEQKLDHLELELARRGIALTPKGHLNTFQAAHAPVNSQLDYSDYYETLDVFPRDGAWWVTFRRSRQSAPEMRQSNLPTDQQLNEMSTIDALNVLSQLRIKYMNEKGGAKFKPYIMGHVIQALVDKGHFPKEVDKSDIFSAEMSGVGWAFADASRRGAYDDFRKKWNLR